MSDFATRMQSLQNEDLLRIMRSQPEDGYLPEAIAFAKAEFETRSISSDALEELEIDLVAERQADVDVVDLPLSWIGRAGFFFFGFTIFGVLAFLVFVFQRKYKKVAQGLISAALGVMFYIVVFATLDIIY